jgi:HK97 family phage portal protein
MGIFSKWFGSSESKRSLENPNTPITDTTLEEGGQDPDAIRIDANSILSIPEFYRAVQIKSGVIASLPFSVVRIDSDKQEKLPTHPVTRLINIRPSDMYTSYSFLETLVTHMELYGNFYAEIRRRQTGEIRSLEILEPSAVKVEKTDRGDVRYIHRTDETTERKLFADRVFHIHETGLSGMAGIDKIKVHKKNFALAIAARDYLANFNANGTFLSGVLKHPAQLKTESAKRLRLSWSKLYAGSGKAGKVAVLEEGMEYQPITVTPTDAGSEFTKNQITADIARITGVPKILLENYDDATLNNAESIAQFFVNYTIRLLVEKIEAEIYAKLIPESQQDNHRAQFDLKGLLRPDAKGRANYIDAMMKYGIINRDEARKMEGLNPIEDGSGQDYLVPLNMFNPNNPNTDGETENN